jgi:hypothetical protein
VVSVGLNVGSGLSFWYLLNAVLLFAGVLAFIIAGFAGTFSRRLSSCRYRLMLAPLGFVIVGSLGRSIAARLVNWFAHAGNLGSGADIFESVVLLLAGVAGVLVGIALGTTLDRVPAAEQTYTIANYWSRRSHAGNQNAASTSSRVARPKSKVIAISGPRKQPGVVRRVNAISEKD